MLINFNNTNVNNERQAMTVPTGRGGSERPRPSERRRIDRDGQARRRDPPASAGDLVAVQRHPALGLHDVMPVTQRGEIGVGGASAVLPVEAMVDVAVAG